MKQPSKTNKRHTWMLKGRGSPMYARCSTCGIEKEPNFEKGGKIYILTDGTRTTIAPPCKVFEL